MSSPTSISNGSVQLNSSTATLIVSARNGRKKLKLAFGSGVSIGDSSLNSSNGFPLGSGSAGETELETEAAVYGISVSGTPTVQFLETYG